MSTTGVDAAIERICADPEFVADVVRDADTALASFDLTEAERTGIGDALRSDIDNATGDVEGFAFGLTMATGGDDGGGDGGMRFSKMPVPNLAQFAAVNGGLGRSPRDAITGISCTSHG